MIPPVEVLTPRYAVIALVAGTLVLVSIGTAEAQQQSNLTRAQEGRVEIAKCYARCISGWERAQGTRIVLDAIDGEWSEAAIQYTSCLLAQTDAIRAEACRSGCQDIEAAYNYRSSHIRTRFHWALNAHLRKVRAAGLWTAWNRYPADGSDAFIRACARYVQALSNRAETAAKKLRAVEPMSPSEFEARRQKVIEEEYQPEPPPLDDFGLLEG
ncbi:MAG: hypothetical protein OXU81_00125 [Gammaproteobacteria bacterium]|nr:hypothetical protein [Gammaproteobacteria bacterium]